MKSGVVKEYTTKIDSKNRITIRDAQFVNYKVSVYDDGRVLLNPRVLIDPNEISEKSLKMLDKSVKNFKEDRASKQIKIDEFNWDED